MDDLDFIAEIQSRIQECRKTAAETDDTELALFLYRMADEIEAEAREMDLK